MQRYEDIAESLGELESEIELQRLRVEHEQGFCVWPVLRHHIASSVIGKRTSTIRYRSAKFVHGAVQRVMHRREPRIQGRDVLMVTGVAHVRMVGDTPTNMSVSPILNSLTHRRVDSLVMEMGRKPSPMAADPSTHLWVTPRINAAVRRHRRMSAAIKELFASGYMRGLHRRLVEQYGLQIEMSDVEKRVLRVASVARTFSKLLEESAARLVFVDYWMNDVTFGILLACSLTGHVKTVELQHGLKTRLQWSYHHFRHVPTNGFELAPDFFWCWTQQDKRIFDETNDPSFASCIVGGNPFLTAWRERALPGIRSERSLAETVHQKFGKIVLVALAPDHSNSDLIKSTIAQAGNEFTWMLRFHRSMTMEQRRPFQLMKQELGSQIELDVANRVNLHTLIEASKIILSPYSTCLLEAMILGKPAIVYHPIGREVYADYFAPDAMEYHDQPGEMLSAIHRMQSEIESQRISQIVSLASWDDYESTLDWLLREAEVECR